MELKKTWNLYQPPRAQVVSCTPHKVLCQSDGKIKYGDEGGAGASIPTDDIIYGGSF